MFFISVTSHLISAEEFETGNRKIEKIRFYGAERPSHIGYQDIAIVQLELGTLNHGTLGACNPTNFSVLNSDKALISALLTARASSLNVVLAVEKNSTYGNGTFCRVVKVEM